MAGETGLDPKIDSWLRGLIRRVGAGVDGRSLEALTVRAGPDRAQVFACGEVVVKLYPRRIDAGALCWRLEAIKTAGFSSLWMQPLTSRIESGPGGRLVWPRGEVLGPGQLVPWAEVARLLATLHSLPASGAPVHYGHERLERAVAAIAAAEGGLYAWLARLGEEVRAGLQKTTGNAWVHGDFHLGQLVKPMTGSRWLLLDPDDLGRGDPIWDLARPAGFWAAGLLDDESWTAFLTAYQAADGNRLLARGDPWLRLELPARAAVIIAAARELSHAPAGFAGSPLLAACRRMAR